MTRQSTILILCSGLLSTAAFAQGPSIYVDIGPLGTGVGVPTTGYAAAAPVGGEWNAMDSDLFLLGSYTTPPLVDIGGTLTGATLTYTPASFTFGNVVANEPSTFGNDEALLDDAAFAVLGADLSWDGLPAGDYDVIMYGLVTDFPGLETRVEVVNSPDPIQTIGGDFSMGFVQGTTHSLHTVTVLPGEPLVIRLDEGTLGGSYNGVQVMAVERAIGIGYCGPAIPNSTGNSAFLTALGSSDPAANDLTLTCRSLPSSITGYFVVSQTQGFVMNPAGSTGNLCLAGDIGRYVGPGQIQDSGSAGMFELAIDLTMVPMPTGPLSVVSGSSWNWQAWFRDSSGGSPTSNFSDGLQIEFL
jgi:hypothetical protein